MSKSGRADTLPLRDDLAKALRAWRTECGAAVGPTRVFNVPAGLVHALARDLLAAGLAQRVRVKDSKGRERWRITTRDADGRTIDVHALRHTTATRLARAGVAPRTAQSIMRHSDIRLTLGTYTDPRLLDVAGALDALPRMGPASEREAARGRHVRRRSAGDGNRRERRATPRSCFGGYIVYGGERQGRRRRSLASAARGQRAERRRRERTRGDARNGRRFVWRSG